MEGETAHKPRITVAKAETWLRTMFRRNRMWSFFYLIGLGAGVLGQTNGTANSIRRALDGLPVRKFKNSAMQLCVEWIGDEAP